MTYQTKQRDILLNMILDFQDNPFKADDLLAKSQNISRATIYRTLDLLESDGRLKKYYVEPDGPAHYQYVKNELHCGDHFHGVCTSCGKLFHIDCHEYSDFLHHFEKDHGFKIDLGQTNFSGTCEACVS